MQFPGQQKPPVGAIFDGGFGSGIDDVLALALLYGLDGKDETRVVSVSTSNSNLKSAALVEVIGRFYAGAVSGDFGSFRRSLPIGLATRTKPSDDTQLLAVSTSPAYTHGIRSVKDTADPRALIRNAFTAQHDENAIALLAGPATNYADTLDLPGVKDLVARKVRFLAVSGPSSRLAADIPAARKLFAEWPSPIVLVPDDIGSNIAYPATSIDVDFAWSKAHPVVDAYRAYKSMPYDAPTSAMAAVLYAIRPKEGYFQLSEPGTITIAGDGSAKFTPSPEGKHRQLVYDPAQKERVIKTYVELTSAKPVVRQPRFRRPQQQQQQQQPPPAAIPPKPPAP